MCQTPGEKDLRVRLPTMQFTSVSSCAGPGKHLLLNIFIILRQELCTLFNLRMGLGGSQFKFR